MVRSGALFSWQMDEIAETCGVYGWERTHCASIEWCEPQQAAALNSFVIDIIITKRKMMQTPPYRMTTKLQLYLNRCIITIIIIIAIIAVWWSPSVYRWCARLWIVLAFALQIYSKPVRQPLFEQFPQICLCIYLCVWRRNKLFLPEITCGYWRLQKSTLSFCCLVFWFGRRRRLNCRAIENWKSNKWATIFYTHIYNSSGLSSAPSFKQRKRCPQTTIVVLGPPWFSWRRLVVVATNRSSACKTIAAHIAYSRADGLW